MKCLVIYSHNSGRRRFAKKKLFIQKQLSKVYSTIDFLCPFTYSEARKEVKKACALYDAIICVGGDGTFNNIVNGVAKVKHIPPLGYLNFGTIGDIGRNFGVSKNLRRALKIITDGYIQPFDIGEINGSYFAYVCTIGRYSDIAYLTPRKKKRALGKVAYYNRAVKELRNKKTVHTVVEADGGHYEADSPFLLLLNGKNVGGFMVNPYCKTNDGKMELYLAKPDIFNGVFHIMSGTKTIIISAKEFDIKTDENMSWCLDGEEGPTGEAHIKCHPGLINVFMKKPKVKR